MKREVQRSAKKVKISGKSLQITARFKNIYIACFPNVIGDDKIDNQEEKNSLVEKQSATLA